MGLRTVLPHELLEDVGCLAAEAVDLQKLCHVLELLLAELQKCTRLLHHNRPDLTRVPLAHRVVEPGLRVKAHDQMSAALHGVVERLLGGLDSRARSAHQQHGDRLQLFFAGTVHTDLNRGVTRVLVRPVFARHVHCRDTFHVPHAPQLLRDGERHLIDVVAEIRRHAEAMLDETGGGGAHRGSVAEQQVRLVEQLHLEAVQRTLGHGGGGRHALAKNAHTAGNQDGRRRTVARRSEQRGIGSERRLLGLTAHAARKLAEVREHLRVLLGARLRRRARHTAEREAVAAHHLAEEAGREHELVGLSSAVRRRDQRLEVVLDRAARDDSGRHTLTGSSNPVRELGLFGFVLDGAATNARLRMLRFELVLKQAEL